MKIGTQAYPHTRSIPPAFPAALGQALVALAAGAALFFLLLGMAPLAYNLVYSERIYPGVWVAGVDLSGLHPPEAAALLSQRLDYPERGQIVFQDGTQVWIAKPRELGLFLDHQSSARAAYSLGREGSLVERLSAQYQAWNRSVDLPPLMVFDERIAQHYLNGIAEQVDLAIIEASLSISGVDVVVHSGQIGRKLDTAAALASLRAHLPTLRDGLIPLVVHETPPVILDTTQQAEIARRILSAPLVIQTPGASENDPGPWTFDPPALAAMLAIERVDTADGAEYQVGLHSGSLRAFLENIAPSFVIYPENARFIFNDDTDQLDLIRPAVIGRALDIEHSLQAINQKLVAGEHTIDLVMDYSNPQVTDDATAETLGVREQIVSYTTYFYGSSGSRIQNIQTASSRFHGVLVPPGATFSMAEVLGNVSLDEGYAEALIIFGGRTIKGVGGGVCQVSTALFRTVFFGGYPVVERYPHAYRVSYYEQTASGGVNPNLAGLDATVFVPVVDFKFINDSPHWLLMETYVNASARTLTWKFYSTSDGRTVEWNTTGPRNRVPPPSPLYEENPELARGEIKQVDWEAEGADVTVERTVMRNGQVYFRDSFYTHYLPWRAVYHYGPGTEVPTPEPSEEP